VEVSRFATEATKVVTKHAVLIVINDKFCTSSGLTPAPVVRILNMPLHTN